jgi:hypothetical protein
LAEGCQCRPQPWSEAERARHRTYAAMPPPATADSGGPAQDPSATSQPPGNDLDALAAPEPIDQTEFEAPSGYTQTLPEATTPTAVPAGIKRPSVERPDPLMKGQAEPWTWFPSDPATGRPKRSFAWPGGR